MGKEALVFGVKGIAGFLGLSVRTVERMLAENSEALPARRIGGRWAANRDELRAFLGGGGG